MTYGYCRVSGLMQELNGNSLEAQEAAVRNAGATVVYKDTMSGTKDHRPQLDELRRQIKSGDTLIVTKLDRFARSTRGGLKIIDEFLERGVTINILNLGILDQSPTGKVIRTVFLAFAEFERDMIAERTLEGKRLAKIKNPEWREGRKEKEVDFGDYPERVKQGKITVKAACNELGISRSLWYKKQSHRAVEQ